MKKLLLTSAMIVLIITSYSQAPSAFSYQAIIRNSDGTIKVNEIVSIQINIVQGTVDGSSYYIETHNTQTNELGLVNLNIGEGATSDDFSIIDWSVGPYFLEISVNGELIGASPLLSVPYALFAASGNEGPPGPVGPKGERGDSGTQGWQGIKEILEDGLLVYDIVEFRIFEFSGTQHLRLRKEVSDSLTFEPNDSGLLVKHSYSLTDGQELDNRYYFPYFNMFEIRFIEGLESYNQLWITMVVGY